MKNIKFAICAFLSLLIVNHGLSMDLDKLATHSGKVYYDISVINSDHNGLLFRHSQGACKVDFKDLSTNIRDLFEPAATPPKSKSHLPTDKAGPTRASEGKSSEIEYVLTIVVRRYLRQQEENAHCLQQRSRRSPFVQTQPSIGSRFDRVHLLHNPVYRAQAKLNFLRFNGLHSPCSNHDQILVNPRFY